MRTSVFNTLGLAMAVVLGSSGTASASTLATTAYALGPWQGSHSYVAAGVLSQNLDATVEFAVFAPGDFQDFLSTENNINFVDPAPSEFIYAYQITPITEATAGISIFTVGLNSNESTGIEGVSFIPMGTNHGGYSPLPAADPLLVGGGPGVSDSSQWNFAGSIGTGQASGILFYSSPQGPEFGFSQVTAGTATTQQANSLPNPVPEPATLVLGLAAVLGLMARRRF